MKILVSDESDEDNEEFEVINNKKTLCFVLNKYFPRKNNKKSSKIIFF